jgi:hypothetical protein
MVSSLNVALCWQFWGGISEETAARNGEGCHIFGSSTKASPTIIVHEL